MLPTPYVASLRVYEPIQVFDPSVQSGWELDVDSKLSVIKEQLNSLHRVITNQAPIITLDGAHILNYEGKKYIAPWSTTARCWSAYEQLKFSLPTPVVKYFISKTFEQEIQRSSLIIEDKISHVLTSTWSIPPRWFALFAPEERLRGVESGACFTVFRTSIRNAKSRCNFTHQAVLGAFGSGAVEAEISELLAWLEIFNENSMVELDYGGLATYLNNCLIENGEIGLEADSSVEDVNSSIAGLASGDGTLAGKGYEKLVMRWRRVASLEFAS
jgi:hypothetical protein